MRLCQGILFTHTEIPNMTEEELLFNFMDNLQGWVEQELRRQGVQDLATTMAVAESFVDYKRGDSSKVESLEDSHVTGGGDEVSRDHNAPRMGSGKTPNVREERGKVERKEFMPKIKCFLCNGPHLAQDFPKRKVLNAMIEEREQEDEAHMGSMLLLGKLGMCRCLENVLETHREVSERGNDEDVDDIEPRKLLKTPRAIYTKSLEGRVWKVLEMPRDVHTCLHYGGGHERSPKLSREF
ncbi:hypothetical protein CK203_049485 [Vitis vinifera]|uniref:Uncharacterized protein n=1 Tax=Vitis vinifera TaxID=29760 RepID=A0A438HAY0_VITVI|nr:hypothetical protein CK203_049485 [Vitis vinifera]